MTYDFSDDYSQVDVSMRDWTQEEESYITGTFPVVFIEASSSANAEYGKILLETQDATDDDIFGNHELVLYFNHFDLLKLPENPETIDTDALSEAQYEAVPIPGWILLSQLKQDQLEKNSEPLNGYPTLQTRTGRK